MARAVWIWLACAVAWMVGTILVCVFVDFLAVARGQPTVTDVARGIFREQPILAFALGLLIGGLAAHLFWLDRR